RKIIIADLSTRDLQAMDTSQLGTVINQYDMKKPGALAYFVIGKVGQRVISKTYKMVSQQLVEPQEKANCGWQSVVNAIAVMKNHKGESFDNDGFGQHQEWVEADPIEVTWNHHARMLDGSVLPFAVIDRDLIVMGQRAIEYTQVAEHYKNPTDFLLEAVRVEFRKPGRQVFGLVVNTGSQNELANPYEHVGSRGSLPGALRHWYGVAILKHEDETKELVFIDSAGVSAEFLGQGAFVANRTRLNHNDPENTQLYALINQLVFE
ncbi:hypothetical protein EBU95_19120, partial [bacterium]|nr:hypothetical protein [bacterium]